MAGYRCPRDRSVLTEIELLRHRVLSCGACAGMWIQGAQVAALFESFGIDAHFAYAAEGRSQGALRCVADGAALQASTHKGVQADVCPSCAGLWTDGGELRRLARRPDAPPEVEPPPAIQAKEERAREDRAWFSKRKPVFLASIVILTTFCVPDLVDPTTVPASDPHLDALQAQQAAAAGCVTGKIPADGAPRICNRIALRQDFEAGMARAAEQERDLALGWLGVGAVCAGLVATGFATAAMYTCAGGFAGVGRMMHYNERRLRGQLRELNDMRQPVP